MAHTSEPVAEAWEYVRSVVRENYSNYMESPDGMTVKVERTTKIWDETLSFAVSAEHKQFLFYITPGLPVPPADLPAVVEYVSRANDGLRIGNFEVDFQERYVRFRSSIAFTGARLTEALIKAAIAPAEVAVDTYMPGLINVITGEQSPVEAVNAIEYG